MILLTKLDNKKVLINLENIKYVESVPDTILFFVNGDSLIVKETIEDISASTIEFRARVIAAAKTTQQEA